MNDLLSQLFLLVFFSAICVYLIISIFKKELPILTRFRQYNYRQYNYKGKRAIILSIFFLIFTLPILFSAIKNSNLITILISSIIGIYLAFILHNILVMYPGTVVPEKIKPRKIEISKLILWGVVGIFIGFITTGLTLSLALIIFPHIFAIIIGILVFSITVAFVAWWGARTTWL